VQPEDGLARRGLGVLGKAGRGHVPLSSHRGDLNEGHMSAFPALRDAICDANHSYDVDAFLTRVGSISLGRPDRSLTQPTPGRAINVAALHVVSCLSIQALHHNAFRPPSDLENR
jgi:hypothetical protein